MLGCGCWRAIALCPSLSLAHRPSLLPFPSAERGGRAPPARAHQVRPQRLIEGCRGQLMSEAWAASFLPLLNHALPPSRHMYACSKVIEHASLPHLTPEERKRHLSFMVVGGGPTGAWQRLLGCCQHACARIGLQHAVSAFPSPLTCAPHTPHSPGWLHTGVELAAELHDFVQEDVGRLMPHLKVRALRVAPAPPPAHGPASAAHCALSCPALPLMPRRPVARAHALPCLTSVPCCCCHCRPAPRPLQDEVSITVVDTMDHLLGAFDRQLSEYTSKHFSRAGIDVQLGTM